MKNLLHKLVLGSSAGALFAAAPFGQALAQDNDIEQVVVSASRITIAGYSQPTPVTVVGAAQLDQDAYANIVDSVRQLPQVTSPPASFGTSQSGSTGGQAGSSFVNLRDLGIVRTLILFDSQRIVQSTTQGGVDITTFPQALIQRVDIVTGGASAAWGSDAVAGVVNFVLNKNYSGFKATLQASDTTDGLVRNISGNVAWGGDIDGGRGHIELSAAATINPDAVSLLQEHWYKAAYWVSNPAFVAGNGQPQLIMATNVAVANLAPGGLIVSSPAGVAGPGVTPAAVNALRGLQFVQGGTPQLVNFGNITLGTLSNGGSLTRNNSQDPWGTVSLPNSTYTAFAYGRYKLTDTIQASVQLNASYFTGKTNLLGLPQASLVVKSDNAYIPASVRSAMQNGGITSFTMGILTTNNFDMNNPNGKTLFAQAGSALGPGTAFNRRNLIRGVFTLEGTLGDDWSWNAYIQHSAVRYSGRYIGDAITANLLAAQDAVTVTSANVGKSGAPLGSIACRNTLAGVAFVNAGVTADSGCIPLNIFGTGVASPSAIGYTMGSPSEQNYVHQSVQQDVMEGSMQGTLPWALPAGKVAVAFGMGYRKEAGRVDVPPLAPLIGYVQADNNVFPSRSYNVIEGFAEVDAPILKDNIVNSLDFSMAGRMTSYSTSGLVETWKLGATSQINDDVKLRTTWSVDIRAPQLNELYNAGQLAIQNQRDPKTQITGSTNVITTGNANLVPEIARTISGGVVLTPTFIPGLNLSADWYSITLTGQISPLAAATILAQCNTTLPSIINPGTNGNPNDPLCSHLVFAGPSGALSQINLQSINIASLTTSGLDLQANYTMDFMGGTLAWATTDNYNDETTVCNPGAGCNNFSGSNDFMAGGGPQSIGAKWKGVVSATYNSGPYSFTVQSRWYGTSVSYQNGNTGNQATAATANLYDPAHFEVPASASLDLRGNYKWNDNISFFGAIDNTLNTPPPLVLRTSANTSVGSLAAYNTNQQVYSLIGRMVRIGIRLTY